MMLITKERGPYFLQNKSFGTVTISVMFPYKYQEDDFMKVRLINDVINRSMNYQTKQDFKNAIINNYIISLYADYENFENTSYTKFILTIPNPQKLKGVSLDNCLKFLADYIYNPFIEDNGLEKNEVAKFIDIYHKNIKESNNLINKYAKRRVFEICAPNTKLSSTMVSHEKELDKITPQNLYNFYKEKIINGNPFVFVMGDVDKQEMNCLINKYIFKKKETTIQISKRQNHFLKPKEVQVITEEKDFFQSFITLVYKVKDMTEKDRYSLIAIGLLLNDQASHILFKKIRLENDLAYTTSAFYRSYYGLLALTALINKTSKNKTIKTFNKVIKLLKDENYITPLLEKIKNSEKINMIRAKDNKAVIFNNFIDETLDFALSDEEHYQRLCAVTAQDIKKLANKLILDTQYFIRGKKDAK